MQRKDGIIRRVLDAAPKGGGLAYGAFAATPTSDVGGSLVVLQDGRKLPYQVVVKSSLHVAEVPRLRAIAARLGPDQALLVLTEDVNPRLAETLSAYGIAFLDAAGNAYLARHGLYCSVVGRRAARPRGKLTGMLLQRSGLKLVFALLSDPALDHNPAEALLNQSVRSMAALADVSIGSVSTLLRDMAVRGFLLDGDNGQRRLVDREALIEKWSSGFVERLRPKLVANRFHATRGDWWRAAKPASAEMLWGGEVAAARMTGHLKPGHFTIYARALSDAWVVRSGLQSDPDGEITVLSPFWSAAVEARWRQSGGQVPKDCVHPLLVYADLLADGDDRDIETAGKLYDKFLRPLATAD